MLVTKSSTAFFAKNESGGKGHNLYLMSQSGFPVPEWVVLGKRHFDEFLNVTKLRARFETILADFLEGRTSGKEAEATITKLIMATDLPEEIDKLIDEGMKILGPTTMISVRSSAADEDGSAHSFAGQLSSFLYVTGREKIVESVKGCWASAFSERGLAYRRENKLDVLKISVAVVLQRMIDPQKSGVMFTCDPIAKKLDKFVVSSVYGVGEGLVSGMLNADSFWLSSIDGAVLEKDIVPKEQMLKKGPNGQCATLSVESSLREAPSLTEKELNELFELGNKIHKDYRRPQDIEWAIAEGKVWLLQTRPVTTIDHDLQGYINLWDNSNIVESYGGLTSPLSFSFALRNYKAVYVQFCEVLGLPNEIIKDMDSYLSYMLGSINGRVFYNLFNWYKLVGVLPGFKSNKEFMETMMGVSEGLSAEIEERTKSHPSWGTWRGKFRTAITGFNFLKYHFIIQSVVEDFLATFHKDYDRYKAMPLTRMRGDELVNIYAEVERNMLGRWKAPIINDFLCMVHFGLLRKLTLKWFGAESTIQNDLLAAEGGLESAEPTKAMIKLAHMAAAQPKLKEIILTRESRDGMEAVKQSEFHDFYKALENYIDKYGFRCMSEMKLEEIDLVTDPSYLFVCLKNYLKAASLPVEDDSKEKERRALAEKKVNIELPFGRRIIYNWVLKHARKAVKNRENTRFARTRIYGVARTIFRSIGEDLAFVGAIENPRDIFWLTIEEVFGIYNGALPSYNLPALIALRKSEYEKFAEEPSSRIVTRGAVYWKNTFQNEVKMAEATDEYDLKGLPCSPGIVEGIVKVVIDPSDNLELNGEILVTARTDPGWVPLYPSISGLLVERGSLLSHSAIVAREMGIPAVVSVPGLIKTIKTGMRVRLDGKAGTIKILE
ncbi:MAG: phosphoenolpyruvate synthase [Bacteriovoracaceae bacterium]